MAVAARHAESRWSSIRTRRTRTGVRYATLCTSASAIIAGGLCSRSSGAPSAAIHALRDAPALAAFARATLEEYADRYDRYPNSDNVLGPSRPFFSTYLESIWLLQLCIAADLLDLADAGSDSTGRFRDRVAVPSAALIRSYDEGGSNRQLWNNAALLAAARTLGDRALEDHAIHGPSGLIAQLRQGLLIDGSWYEGENYHLFSHRGLWYGITMAERAGHALPAALLDRFQAGFSTPFLTAFPDLTFPARRDSQYGASLRQWRTAESCELGLARRHDARLTSALAALYAADIPHLDTGRWRSTAEAERNEPASALSRADLSWRSLLFAREQLPPLTRVPMRSALLEGQGIAVFRREAGDAYAALDYGHHGGGHGHPDRLNILLARGARRILDDMGTGSYVDSSLHWYRSTLAHNAPLVNGRSQPRASGTLLAWDEQPERGWVRVTATISDSPPVQAERALTVLAHAIIDELRWTAGESVRIELPIHARVRLANELEWIAATLDGGDALEDGFAHVRDARRALVSAGETVQLIDDATGKTIAWSSSFVDAEWWSAIAPGAPGMRDERFVLVRMHGPSGTIRTVWDWSESVRDVRFAEREVAITDASGAVERYSWDAALTGPRDPLPARDALPPAPSPLVYSLPFARDLGEADYRTSELSWSEAGAPTAHVAIRASHAGIEIHVSVRKSPLFFRSSDAPDPALDNEDPDINSDGVQLHLWHDGWAEPVSWLAVPEPGTSIVRVRQSSGAGSAPPLSASWRETAQGYEMTFAVPRDAVTSELAIDVLINDMSADRERRRGQLVLSGARGERVYLRGDRQPVDSYLHVRLGP
ncbi:MAG: heparinase II/III family protein [Gemmatimonadales bacterium]